MLEAPSVTPRGFAPHLLLVASLALVETSCASLRSAPVPAPPSLPEGRATLATRRVDARPELTVVVRDGDPASGVAIALALPEPGEALLLGALLTQRLHSAEANTHVSANAYGVVISTIVEAPAEIKPWLARVDAALRQPSVSQELEPTKVDAWLIAQSVLGAADEPPRLARCVGTLLAPGRTSLPRQVKDLELSRLEEARVHAYSLARARLAVVGAGEHANAVEQALGDLPHWPAGTVAPSLLPGGDVVTFLPGRRRLSLLVHQHSANAALALSNTLLGADSPLRQRLAAVDPNLTLGPQSGTTLHSSGACSRIDVTSVGEPESVAASVPLVTALLVDEVTRASALVEGPSDSANVVLQSPNPETAARLAAWRSLGPSQPGKQRSLELFAPAPDRAEQQAEISRQLEAQLTQFTPVMNFEHRVSVERGQGDVLVLLASPCGTLAETPLTSGAEALWLLASTLAGPHQHDIQFEPWLTPEGTGVLAHTGHLRPDETPDQVAQRLGESLGELLTTSALDGSALARARAELNQQLDLNPRPTFSLAAEALSPGRPGFLFPFGTFIGASTTPSTTAQAARHRWQTGPLRLAVLANGTAEQSRAVERGLARWLPPRPQVTACPTLELPELRSTELTWTAGSDGAAEPLVTAALSLPPLVSADDEAMALALESVLRSPKGPLARSLTAAGFEGPLEMVVIGGRLRRGLLWRLGGPEGAVDAKLTLLRKGLEQLGRGEISDNDAHDSLNGVRRAYSTTRLDPRRRLVDLWRAEAPPTWPGPEQLRQFARRALVGRPWTLVRRKTR